MCAPSMPLFSEPSTRLSRVAPQDACLATSTSGMPCLAKRPFSLAMTSGDGVDQRDVAEDRLLHLRALRFGDVHAERKLRLRGADQRGRAGGRFQKCAAADAAGLAGSLGGHRLWRPFAFASLVRTASCAQPAGNKKAAAREALLAFPQDSGVASCGPPLDRPAVANDAGFESLLFKGCANSAGSGRFASVVSALARCSRSQDRSAPG